MANNNDLTTIRVSQISVHQAPRESVLPSQKCQHFQKVKSSNALTSNEQQYEIVGNLEGRGQPNAAYFIKPSDKTTTYLLKEDMPGTCLAEALAGASLPSRLPTQLKPAANFAKMAQLTKENGRIVLATIQSKVAGEDMPTVAFGVKRTPKAVIETGKCHQHTLDDFRRTLPATGQWSLAAGLFLSFSAGDESTHIGQFMVSPDNTGQPQFVRIDFGAANRFAACRKEEIDLDPFHASSFYNNRPDVFGKDYSYYQLQSQEIRCKYALLFLHQEVPQQNVLKQKYLTIIHSIQDEDLKCRAIAEFTLEMFKSTNDSHQKKQITALKKALKQTTVATQDIYTIIQDLLALPSKSQNIRENTIENFAETLANLAINRTIAAKKETERRLSRLLEAVIPSEKTRRRLQAMLANKAKTDETFLKNIYISLNDAPLAKKIKILIEDQLTLSLLEKNSDRTISEASIEAKQCLTQAATKEQRCMQETLCLIDEAMKILNKFQTIPAANVALRHLDLLSLHPLSYHQSFDEIITKELIFDMNSKQSTPSPKHATLWQDVPDGHIAGAMLENLRLRFVALDAAHAAHAKTHETEKLKKLQETPNLSSTECTALTHYRENLAVDGTSSQIAAREALQTYLKAPEHQDVLKTKSPTLQFLRARAGAAWCAKQTQAAKKEKAKAHQSSFSLSFLASCLQHGLEYVSHYFAVISSSFSTTGPAAPKTQTPVATIPPGFLKNDNGTALRSSLPSY